MNQWWKEELTEIKGSLVECPKLITVLGRESRTFRKIYSRLARKYWWGMTQLLVDCNTTWRT